MKIIDNWRNAWRMLTVQIATAAIAFGMLPADAQAAMLEAIGVPGNRITAILGALVLFGRLVSQPAVQKAE